MEMFRCVALRTVKTMSRVLVDTAMGDGGKLYRLCTPDMVTKMGELCGLADLIVPNVTEAAFLLGEPQLESPYSQAYIDKLMQGLTDRFTGDIVLTGVSLSAGEIGCICLSEGRQGRGRFSRYRRLVFVGSSRWIAARPAAAGGGDIGHASGEPYYTTDRSTGRGRKRWTFI